MQGTMASSVGPSGGRCIACQGAMQSIGIERFRVGGTTGGWKLLFGEWAELGEDMLSFEILACTSCRRVELRVPPGGT
jgi:hypothetical protein